MLRFVKAALSAVLLLSPSTASAAPFTFASGILALSATDDDLIGGPGGWDTGTLTYTVAYDPETGHYLYSYTLNGLTTVDGQDKDISHVITQVSDTFTEDNIFPGTTDEDPAPDTESYELGTYSEGGSNPGLPATITGIKFDPVLDNTSFAWLIETDRAPMWGNFYAVNGKSGDLDVWIYNSGFALVGGGGTLPDCYLGMWYTYKSCSGVIGDTPYAFLLVPDTTDVPPPDVPGVVPEPATLSLLGLGLLAAAGAGRRRLARRRRPTCRRR